MAIDWTTDFGKTVAQRLAHDEIVWLTTSGANGAPQPNPVWYLFHDGAFLIFSEPNQAKLKNISRNGVISLNLNSNSTGGEVTIINGAATIDPNRPPQSELDAYLAKYGQRIIGIDMTNDSFLAAYSVVVRVAPEKLRGH